MPVNSETEPDKPAPSLPPPISEVRLVKAKWNPRAEHYENGREFSVAVQIGKAWYLSGTFASNGLYAHSSFTIGGTEVKPIGPAEEQLVVLTIHESENIRWSTFEGISILVIGVGPSGVPSAVGPVEISSSASAYSRRASGEFQEEYKETVYDWKFKDGALLPYSMRSATQGGIDRARRKPLSDRYSLQMP